MGVSNNKPWYVFIVLENSNFMIDSRNGIDNM